LDKTLPSLTLDLVYADYIARLTRGGMLEVLSQDFFVLPELRSCHTQPAIVIKHALKGGILPVVSFLWSAVAWLLSDSFVVETIFQIPGLGRFYIQAAFNRDYTMIMGTAIFFSILIIMFNLLSDIILAILDPRISYEGKD